MTRVIEAFEKLDYRVVEWSEDHVTVRSVHDHQNPRITIHIEPGLLTPEWVASHFIDRMTPYLEAAYESGRV